MKSIREFFFESRQMQRYAGVRGKKKPKHTKAEEEHIARSDSAFYFKFRYDGWDFVPSIHAASQAFDRRSDMSEDDWKDFHKKVYDKLLKLKPINGEFVFFSKKWQQAYVASVDFDKKIVRIITVFPKGHSNPKPGTIRMIIEGKIVELQTIEIE